MSQEAATATATTTDATASGTASSGINSDSATPKDNNSQANNNNDDQLEIGPEEPVENATTRDDAEAVPLASEDVAELQHLTRPPTAEEAALAEQAKKALEQAEKDGTATAAPVQSGPLIDLFGPKLLRLDMIDSTHAQFQTNWTSDALRNKKVIGIYFSADWCGPCRKFTPELVSFYDRMNSRRGWKNQFEIVWVSRCRDLSTYGQYFTHMGGWYALPPEEAMGQRGQLLGQKYGVKSIPSLVLVDDLGHVITTDARNKIPADKTGIGFPWRNPLATLYISLVPRTIRLMVRAQVDTVKDTILQRMQQVLQPSAASRTKNMRG